MERFPMLWEGKTCGELTAEREGLYTRFSARGRLPEEKELWCAWIVGEQGELRLGVLEPEQDRAVICRRFSGAATAPLGRILRAEVRRVGEEPRGWKPVADPAGLFRTAWLRQRLQGMQGVLTCQDKDNRLLALPWDKRRPFPLALLFCLARLQCIGSRYYVVYCFDREEQPVFGKEGKKF